MGNISVSYISLDELKRVLEDEELSAGKADNILRRFCVTASRHFDALVTNKVYPPRRFYPVLETRYFDHPAQARGIETVALRTGDPRELRLRDDLLELTALTTDNGFTAVTSGYNLYTWPGRYRPTPYDTIGFDGTGPLSSFSYRTAPQRANAVSGWWGYHEDWESAWEDSGDSVVDDPLSDSATIVTVNDAEGQDAYGIDNRFQNLQLLKIGDECIWVNKVNPTSNELTVIRGVCGTTAEEHAASTPIYIYRAMHEVKMALEYLALHLYKRKDSVGTPDQRPLAAAKGLLIFPASMPKEVSDIIDAFKKESL